jgi:hypothetical protein
MAPKIIGVPRVAAVRFRMAAMFSPSTLTLAPGKPAAVGENIWSSMARWRPSVAIARPIWKCSPAERR